MPPTRYSQREDDATRGLTLRELVLEVRADGKETKGKVDAHLQAHAVSDGVQRGEAKVLGFAKSTIAIIVSISSAAIAILTGLHLL